MKRRTEPAVQNSEQTPIFDMLALERQEAEHHQHIADSVRDGQCPYSGLTGPECKSWLCDCFEFEHVWGRSRK